MVRTLRSRGNDFGVDENDLARRYPFDSVQKWGAEYYDFLDPYLSPAEERLSAILEIHIERLKQQGTRYAEIFVSRLIGTTNDMGALTELFRRFRHRAESAAGDELSIEFVVAIGRGPAARLERQAAKVEALFDAGLIAGVALAGDESACDLASVQPIFERLRARGMGIEIHAGEFRDASSVWDAVLHGFPTRIGHGVAAFSDAKLVDTLAEKAIHLELCPTSNLRLGVIKHISELPVRQALRAGIEFSINTDDPGPFDCSLTSELSLVAEAFELSDAELLGIYDNTRKAAFAKSRLAGASR